MQKDLIRLAENEAKFLTKRKDITAGFNENETLVIGLTSGEKIGRAWYDSQDWTVWHVAIKPKYRFQG